jgi:hypothetical protein
MLNPINEALRAAESALKIARSKGDKRGEGVALEALRIARTRQMKRDKRKHQGQFAPARILAAKLVGKAAAMASFIALAAAAWTIVNHLPDFA